jgi:hypothetical protein
MPLQSPLCYSANRQKINQFHSFKWNLCISPHPPLPFNPLLTSCFSRRRHIAARHGVAIEDKNNWHQCWFRLLWCDYVTSRHVALGGGGGGAADGPDLCSVSVTVTCVLGTESLNCSLGPHAVTESLNCSLGPHAVTESLNCSLGPHAVTESLNCSLGPHAVTESLNCSLGPHAVTESLNCSLGPHAVTESLNCSLAPFAVMSPWIVSGSLWNYWVPKPLCGSVCG